MRNYLIYTSAGRSANIKQWYHDSDKNYDLWVTNFTDIPGLNQQYSDFYNQHPGSKFQNLYHVYQEHQEVLAHYHAIMVMDDDIIISSKSLTALFNLHTENDLWLLQPAFSRFGQTSHDITRRRLLYSLRFTNFVEVGCPIIKTDKLFEFLDIYQPEISTCAGIDYWMPYLFGIDRKDKYAISDQYYCVNPRSWTKHGRKREIDLITNTEHRTQMVQRIYSILEINQFVAQEYKKTKRHFGSLIVSLPLFVVEIIFFIFVKFYLTIKKLVNQ